MSLEACLTASSPIGPPFNSGRMNIGRSNLLLVEPASPSTGISEHGSTHIPARYLDFVWYTPSARILPTIFRQSLFVGLGKSSTVDVKKKKKKDNIHQKFLAKVWLQCPLDHLGLVLLLSTLCKYKLWEEPYVQKDVR